MPGANMFAGFKSSTVRGRAHDNFNSLVFVDKKGQEHVAIHSERHMMLIAEFDVVAHDGRAHFQTAPAAHMVTVGKLLGGGSGGGGNVQVNPPSKAALGLGASVTYGNYFTSSVPQYMQLATGGQLKLCADPLGFAFAHPGSSGALGDVILRLVGSGITGNVQLTLGTYANIVMGQAYDVILGPEKITLHSYDKDGAQPGVWIIGLIILILALLFQLVYCLKQDDGDNTWHADWVIVFQLAIQACIATLMGFENLQHTSTEACDQLEKALHASKKVGDQAWNDAFNEFDTRITKAGWAAACLPLVALAAQFATELAEGSLHQSLDYLGGQFGKTGT